MSRIIKLKQFRQHRVDRILLIGSFVLFLFQSYLLIGNYDFFSSDHNKNKWERLAIGQVTEISENVKRKGPDSIVWETSEKKESLHAYDSLLTLSNSSARIQLVNKTVIELHENTLVVLEPLPENSNDKTNSFRVKFSRGNFKAKTKDTGLNVEVEEWTVQADAGSEMTLKTLEEGQFEIEMRTGVAKVQKVNGADKGTPIALQNGMRATIVDNKVTEILKLSQEIKILNSIPARVYTHEEMVKYQIRWNGVADKMRIVLPDRVMTSIDITAEQKEIILPFRKGIHFISLSNAGVSSEEMILDVRLAPKIRYIQPRFRDRLEMKTAQLFSWFPISIAQAYKVHLGDDIVDSSQTFLYMKPQAAGAKNFFVEGIDSDGVTIPFEYQVPVFNVQDPFQAPKLRKPSSDEGADKTSEDFKKENHSGLFNKKNMFESVYKILFALTVGEPVLAQEIAASGYSENKPSRYERKRPKINFEWDAVEGADFYLVEISTEPDFSSVEVEAKVREERFQWRKYKFNKYYWRVAAGSDAGRMGLFTEPIFFDLGQIDKHKGGALQPGISIEFDKTEIIAKPEPEPVKENIVVKPEEPAPVLEQNKTTPEFISADADHWRVSVNLHNQYYSYESEISTTLQGLSPLSLSFEFESNKQNHWKSYLRWTDLTWEPKNENEIPYQEELKSNHFRAYTLYDDNPFDLSWGLSFETLYHFKKSADEEIKIETVYLLGPMLGLNFQALKNINMQFTAGLITNGEDFAFQSTNYLRFQKVRNKDAANVTAPYFYGIDLDLLLFFGPESTSGFLNTAGFHFGREW